MANLSSVAYPVQQQGGHAYGGPATGTSYPTQIPFHQFQHQQQYPASFLPGSDLAPQQALSPRQLYQPFQQPHASYGSQSPQPGHPMTTSPPQPSPAVYTSASFTQPVYSASAPAPVSQAGTVAYTGTAAQQAQNMATPAVTNNMVSQRQPIPNGALAQQGHVQDSVQNQTAAQAQGNPQTAQIAARERARVAVLLEINTHLLQEVVSLQVQGKAGVPNNQAQQSPMKDSTTSPPSATDPSHPLNNSPIDPSKPSGGKPPSAEYVECMRRLQANLSYLAAIADAKKKASGTIPAGPAIMAPPPHLPNVTELYKKLNALFPNASQSTVNKAMAIASAQAAKAQAAAEAQG